MEHGTEEKTSGRVRPLSVQQIRNNFSFLSCPFCTNRFHLPCSATALAPDCPPQQHHWHHWHSERGTFLLHRIAPNAWTTWDKKAANHHSTTHPRLRRFAYPRLGQTLFDPSTSDGFATAPRQATGSTPLSLPAHGHQSFWSAIVSQPSGLSNAQPCLPVVVPCCWASLPLRPPRHDLFGPTTPCSLQ